MRIFIGATLLMLFIVFIISDIEIKTRRRNNLFTIFLDIAQIAVVFGYMIMSNNIIANQEITAKIIVYKDAGCILLMCVATFRILQFVATRFQRA